MSPEHSSPGFEIDFADPAPPWRERLPGVEGICAAAARAALAAGDLRQAELSIVLSDDAAVRRLNREWRGHDKPTNVLSFAAPRAPGAAALLGDVVLAFETVAREA